MKRNLFSIFFCLAALLTACSPKFREPNELAIPPFFKEEYEELHRKKGDPRAVSVAGGEVTGQQQQIATEEKK
jgi:hypothetical protein